MKSETRVLSLLLVIAGALAAQNDPAGEPRIGEKAYEIDFRQSFSGWVAKPPSSSRQISGDQGGLEISARGGGGSGEAGARDVLGVVDRSQAASFLVSIGLGRALSKYRGCLLEVVVRVRADQILTPAKPWEGLRIVMNYATSTTPFNHCAFGNWGTFPVKDIRYRTRIPADAKDISMDLGLLAPAGSAVFESVALTVVDLPLAQKTPPVGPAYKGHPFERLRGFVTGIADAGDEKGQKAIGEIGDEWKANMFKLWFRAKGDPAQVDRDLAAWLPGVDRGLAFAKSKGLYVVLHLGAFEWGVREHGDNSRIYEDPAYAQKVVDIWKLIAARYKGNTTIYAFELLNESCLRMPPAPGCPDYETLMERAALAVNAIDPARTVLVQPEEWWGIRSFERLRPIRAPNVVYAPHVYHPFSVTHSGVGAWYAQYRAKTKNVTWEPKAYPGLVDGILWDKDAVRRELQPARDFQIAYNVHMNVSEFSCVRWAPGESRVRLLRDMIDLFEEYGWDWMYHGYPEFNGWMPQLGSDPFDERRPLTPTATEELLKGWFSKNQWLPHSAQPVVLAIPEPAGSNILPNGGIERGTEGWLAHSDFSKGIAFQVKASNAHQGSACLRITKAAGTKYGGVLAQAPLENGKTYRLTCWMRMEEGSESDLHFTVQYPFGPSGRLKQIGVAFSPAKIFTKEGWTRLTGRFTLRESEPLKRHPHAGIMLPTFTSETGATYDLDDLELCEVATP
ncbi:MAG: cellulase family glycosylhydrolase [Spirochaetes bacterium]|nr:cellulase family glycosylhydrolase [Spirochaetota bacterium]